MGTVFENMKDLKVDVRRKFIEELKNKKRKTDAKGQDSSKFTRAIKFLTEIPENDLEILTLYKIEKKFKLPPIISVYFQLSSGAELPSRDNVKISDTYTAEEREWSFLRDEGLISKKAYDDRYQLNLFNIAMSNLKDPKFRKVAMDILENPSLYNINLNEDHLKHAFDQMDSEIIQKMINKASWLKGSSIYELIEQKEIEQFQKVLANASIASKVGVAFAGGVAGFLTGMVSGALAVGRWLGYLIMLVTGTLEGKVEDDIGKQTIFGVAGIILAVTLAAIFLPPALPFIGYAVAALAGLYGIIGAIGGAITASKVGNLTDGFKAGAEFGFVTWDADEISKNIIKERASNAVQRKTELQQKLTIPRSSEVATEKKVAVERKGTLESTSSASVSLKQEKYPAKRKNRRKDKDTDKAPIPILRSYPNALEHASRAAHEFQIMALDHETIGRQARQFVRKVRELKSSKITDADLIGLKVVNTANTNQYEFQLPRCEGKREVSHCYLDTEKSKMNASLSRTASDSSYIAFCKLFKEFSPLSLQPASKDPDVAIKLLQAAKLTGIVIKLLPEDEILVKRSQKHEELYKDITEMSDKQFQKEYSDALKEGRVNLGESIPPYPDSGLQSH